MECMFRDEAGQAEHILRRNGATFQDQQQRLRLLAQILLEASW